MQRRNSLGVGGATGIRHPHPCLPERACGDRARLHFAGFPRPPLEPGGRDRIKPPRENRGKAQPRGKESKVRSLCQKQTTWKVPKIKVANMAAKAACQSLNPGLPVAPIKASCAMKRDRSSRETRNALSRPRRQIQSGNKSRGRPRPKRFSNFLPGNALPIEHPGTAPAVVSDHSLHHEGRCFRPCRRAREAAPGKHCKDAVAEVW
jgi:hypothetical protein